MPVRFRVLGEIEASVGGTAVHIGSPRQRGVLAVLLAEPNRVLSVDQIVDRLWGEWAPHTARGTLRAYLSRLRSALAHDEDVTIEHRPSGYVLTVDPLMIDLYEFRHLVAGAHTDTDEDDAAARYARARRLWRGEPFAGIDTAWFNRMRESLESERYAVELDHTDLRLRRGRHGLLLPELTDRAASRPFDERAAGQLMLVLYRTGRQADALRHYEQFRSRLAEELGANPGSSLQDLHQQILRADPTLSGHAVTPPGRSPHHRPAQLPADTATFIGRTTELNDILNAWPSGPDEPPPSNVGIIAIDGMAGVGKTALAVHAAHRLKDQFPDGQLFVDLRGFTKNMDPLTPADALSAVLRATGVPKECIPQAVDERAALLRSTLAGRRVLVLLDNVRSETQVRPLLPGTPGCLVLITSRRRLANLDDVRLVPIDILPLADAVALFVGTVGRDRLATIPPHPVVEIVKRCGQLPLAVRLAAARLRARPTWTPRHLADQLSDQREILRQLELGDRSIRSAFALSYQYLDSADQRMFRLLGLHSGPDIDVAAAAALSDGDVRETRRLLENLVDSNLLHQPAPGRFAYHDLLRTYAATIAVAEDTEKDRTAAITRLVEYYTRTAMAMINVVYPAAHYYSSSADTVIDRNEAAGWLKTELPNLIAAAAGGNPKNAETFNPDNQAGSYSFGEHSDTVELPGRTARHYLSAVIARLVATAPTDAPEQMRNHPNVRRRSG